MSTRRSVAYCITTGGKALKTVLITGASSGVGAAAAQAFAAEGYRVILVARSLDALQVVADGIGTAAIVIACDAADGAAVSEMAAGLDGVPDVIIHSAGAGQWKTVQDTTPEEARQMMDAPYHAAFNVTQVFLAGMLARGSGAIIHVNSPASIAPWPSSAGYAAARGAMRTFHNALSQDLAGTGVTSSHVIFGRIDSPYFDNNPGVVEKMPKIGAMIPTLTLDACARVLVDVARRPRHEVIVPFRLRLTCMMAAVLPGFSRWLLRL
jgi:short-subunit dehydrogenase